MRSTRRGYQQIRSFSVFRVDSPAQLIFGGGTVKNQLVTVARSCGVMNPLIITDKFMTSTGKATCVTDPLNDGNMNYGVFDDAVPDPTTKELELGVQAYFAGGHDGLIALGGGSPIDTAKGIRVLATNEGPFRKYKFPNIIPNAGPPLIAIPTTAGTGSEVTKVTVVTDVETNEKMMCSNPYLTPTAAIVDYELTLTCPRRLTADTGIDSLTHAIEAYVSRKNNPYSDAVAKLAMDKIARYIRIACEDPSNHEAREAMMVGATMGGLAFSNSSVCLVHGMSRPIGAHFHVPHGLSNAMLLPEITEFSIPEAEARYADCARAMNLVSTSVSNSGACDALLDEIKALNRDLNVPTIKEFGVDEQTYFDLITLMSDQALASGSPNNNPRVPSLEELTGLYTKVYNYQ